MKFAHFSHIWAKPGMTPHQRYEQLWREPQLCDAIGFDHSFCVEHHFRPDESWMSAPSLYAVGAGARTRCLRIGRPAVLTQALRHDWLEHVQFRWKLTML